MTHPAAELLRAIADGKNMEATLLPGDKANWFQVTGDMAAAIIGRGLIQCVRIARPMVTRTVTYPEPLRVKPERGMNYWYMGPCQTAPIRMPWLDDDCDEPIFAAGMAFATEADAAEAHRALFGAQT